MNNFKFTLWDVEHGLSIWIQTPKFQHHCIDVGKNNENDFSPYHHMEKFHNVDKIDFLIISHPDRDHIEGLPNFIDVFKYPRVLYRNNSLPESYKYGDCENEYQKILKEFDRRYRDPVDKSEDPRNPDFNGGITVECFCNNYCDNMSKNDTSIVAFYEFKNYLFVMPGDIEPSGWSMLYKLYENKISSIVKKVEVIILVAPHHGRESGYSQEMIDIISPNIVLISDKYGEQKTDARYYEKPYGVRVVEEGRYSRTIKYISTKTNGRISFCIDDAGECLINYNNHTQKVLF